MEFIEEKLEFSEPVEIEKSPALESFGSDALPTIKKMSGDTEMAGVIVRIGNRPIARNLKEILELSNKKIPPEIEVLFKKNDIYSIVHGIGAVRVEGKAKIDELQFHSKVINIKNSKIIDLIPSTRFKEVFKADVIIQGSIFASGNVSAGVPDDLLNTLLPKYLSLGGGMQIQLSSNASFIGKFNFSVKYPVITSMGIASDICSWVLNPDEEKTPLLGDQLLIQIIAVPKETKELKYEVQGALKVDRGILHFQQTKETKKHEIAVEL